MRKKQKILPNISEILLLVIIFKAASVFGKYMYLDKPKVFSTAIKIIAQLRLQQYEYFVLMQAKQHAIMDKVESYMNVCQINSYRDSMMIRCEIRHHHFVYWKNVKIYV